MTGPLATIVIVGSLILALWSVVLLIADRPPGRPLWWAIVALEAVVIVFAGWGFASGIARAEDFPRLEFYLYLLGIMALVPMAARWIRDERSRAAAGVLLVAFLVLPVMVVRVQQVWAMASG